MTSTSARRRASLSFASIVVLGAAVIASACSSASGPASIPDPMVTPASAQTLSEIGVANWGITEGPTSFQATGYDGANNPILTVSQTIEDAGASGSLVKITVTGAQGSGTMSNTISSSADPNDSTRALVQFQILENSFPDNPMAETVADRLQADMAASEPAAPGLAGGQSLAEGVMIEDIPIPLTNKCVNVTFGCGKSLAKTGMALYKAIKGCFLLGRTVALTASCAIGSSETLVGPAICFAVGAPIAASQVPACASGAWGTYTNGKDAVMNCQKDCAGSGSGSGSSTTPPTGGTAPSPTTPSGGDGPPMSALR